jgi:hypothetical protein
MRFTTILLLVLLTGSALAQQTLFIRFPDERPREVWTYKGLPTEAPSNPITTEKSSFDLPVPVGDADTIYVWDKTSGNIARKPLSEVRSAGTWTVRPEDYTLVAKAAVEVRYGDAPVAAASVIVNDGVRDQRQLLDEGVATFFALRPGAARVTVEYRSEGRDAPPVTQLLDLTLDREEPVPTLIVAVPNATRTLTGAPTSAATESSGAATATQASEPPKAPSLIGQAVVYLLGLGIVAAVVFFAMRAYKQNPEAISAKLEQLGVEIPKPGDADADLAPPPPPAKPEPVQPILLNGAAPELLTATPMAVAARTVTGEPRIMSEAGDELPLPEGEFTVGREAGLGLSLIGESTVSRRHATLERQGNQVRVKDLGSTNGTFVNGVKVNGETTLNPGDSVQFGSVKFRYEG